MTDDGWDEATEAGADALRDLLEVLEMLVSCVGNKAKLELAQMAAVRYLELQDICKSHRFTIAVGVEAEEEEVINA